MATTFVGSLIEQRRPIQICDLGPIPTKVRTHRSKIISRSGPIMLKNDEIFWHPSQKGNASCLSWGGSGGDFGKLWNHSKKKWKFIVDTLRDANLPLPLETPLSARCRHLLFTRDNLMELLRSEAESCDWLLSLSVFYHVDDATAVAIISEMGKLLKPGGYALIHGWNDSTPAILRERGNLERLFARYPQYFINWDLVQSSLALDYRKIYRNGIVVYQKSKLKPIHS